MNEQRALVVRGNPDLPDATTWQTTVQVGKDLFASGLLPSAIKSPQAAAAVIQKGRELGAPPMYALSNIYVVNGKPACSAELMAALIYRDHGDAALDYIETDNTRCRIGYRRRGGTDQRSYAFTIEDAKQAGLLDGPNAANWKKYPAAMLRARCISAVARFAFPDSIGGMYSFEELNAPVTVTADGEVIYDEQPTEATFREVSATEPPDPHPDRISEAELAKLRSYAERCGVHRITLLNEAKRQFGKVDFDLNIDEARRLSEWCRAEGRKRLSQAVENQPPPEDSPTQDTLRFDPEADADLIPDEEPAS